MSELAKILIVDDSSAERREIMLALEGFAVQIYECHDSSAALADYRVHLPDWVWMDIRTKRTDGLWAIRQIKTVFPDARIIAVTTGRADNMREAALSAGACAYIVKPIS